jgi:hypothetical protein
MVAKIEAAFAPIIAPGWLDAPDIAEHVARAQHIIDEVPGVYRPRDTDSGRQTLLNEVFRLISYLPTRHLPDLIGYLDQKLQQNRVDKDEGSLLNKIESTHEKPNLSVFGKGPTTS